MKQIQLIISCEHAVNDIPTEFAHCFSEYPALLTTHRGIDFGALHMAKALSHAIPCELVSATVSRMLIDCNRSLSHPNCFSELTSVLSEKEKQHIIATWYQPYRDKLTEKIGQYIKEGKKVWHLSIHSFTPVWKGITRQADIGLLYDPARKSETSLARHWQNLLKQEAVVRRNYPYRGTSDGFTVALRKQFTDKEYVGIEVEVNQAISRDHEKLELVTQLLVKTLQTIIGRKQQLSAVSSPAL